MIAAAAERTIEPDLTIRSMDLDLDSAFCRGFGEWRLRLQIIDVDLSRGLPV